MFSIALRKVVLLATLAAVAGCAGKDPYGREGLAGVVTFRGRPLEAGIVEFLPPDPNQGISARALIHDGKFAIPQVQGVPPGTYRVLITSPEPNTKDEPVGPPGMKMPPLGQERIPAKFNRDSQLTVEVRANDANTFDFKID
jgi:hypothetical protein